MTLCMPTCRALQAKYDKCRAKFAAVCVGPAMERNEGGGAARQRGLLAGCKRAVALPVGLLLPSR